MNRTLVVALLGLAVGTSAVLADVIQGTIEKTDAGNNVLEIKAQGKSRAFTVQKDADIFYRPVGKTKGAAVADGLKGLKVGQEVIVWTETKDGKEVVTQVRVEDDAPVEKKKKKKKKKAK